MIDHAASYSVIRSKSVKPFVLQVMVDGHRRRSRLLCLSSELMGCAHANVFCFQSLLMECFGITFSTSWALAHAVSISHALSKCFWSSLTRRCHFSVLVMMRVWLPK